MIGHFNADKVKPFEAAQQINQPVLMVHGTADTNIDIKYGKRNFKNLASTEKTFLEIQKANHGNVWRVGGVPYFKRIVSFMNEVSIENKLSKN